MTYVHCVFFACKAGTPAAEIDAQVADARAILARIPTVREIESGQRDETVNRDVSVTDYEIGLVVFFDDKPGYDVYSDHPLHLEYIGKHKDKWTGVRVFDYVADHS